MAPTTNDPLALPRVSGFFMENSRKIPRKPPEKHPIFHPVRAGRLRLAPVPALFSGVADAEKRSEYPQKAHRKPVAAFCGGGMLGYTQKKKPVLGRSGAFEGIPHKKPATAAGTDYPWRDPWRRGRACMAFSRSGEYPSTAGSVGRSEGMRKSPERGTLQGWRVIY